MALCWSDALLFSPEARRAWVPPDLPARLPLGRFMGLLCLIAVLDGARPDHVPEDPWIRRWEGWVLGQTDIPREVA